MSRKCIQQISFAYVFKNLFIYDSVGFWGTKLSKILG